ncbi:glycoprotein-N-acetylgalactosamine 3-beta-galactosyltransferase 1 [Orussus abietinus]|uniref:glycoprotein-N-acetylgalactosamine 3-beta-galactosyltransferase 1 n=1 Tax=Orussus abietinus TaxID=222816 RepID=UPI000626D6DB|nr:glycoprotein-N-acetylgalactosamine 3-beta-galactosyltransferase 1 [Orussus abietinus]
MWTISVRSKAKSGFLTGFVLGATLALLVAKIGYFTGARSCEKNCAVSPENKHRIAKHLTKSVGLFEDDSTNKLSYQEWLKNQNVETFRLDMDYRVYGPEKSRDLLQAESEWLKSKVHVTCVVFVERLKLARTIKSTWGKRCDKLHYFGHTLSDAEVPVIKFPVNLTSTWQLLCEAMNYVWNSAKSEKINQGKSQWVIFVKDDTMVIPENLRFMVAPLDDSKGHYLGHAVVLWGQVYNIAQAGYALSRGALQNMVDMFNTSEKCASSGKYWKKEDYYLGKHLSSLGIYPTDTRDEYLRGTFHGYSLQTLLWGVARPGSYWTRALYPPGPECCSPKSITFGIGESDKMYTLNYLLYHLHVYVGPGIYGNKPAPTSKTEEEIWRSVLRDEFNITETGDISSERYYNIWKERCSEPEQFIMKNYKNMPDVLDSLLTAYESGKHMTEKNLLN